VRGSARQFAASQIDIARIVFYARTFIAILEL
jgi:hypothetical protein